MDTEDIIICECGILLDKSIVLKKITNPEHNFGLDDGETLYQGICPLCKKKVEEVR